MTTATAILLPDLPITEYGADRVGAPVATINSGTANLILNRSPWHAWWASPNLNPDWTPRTTNDAMDLGSACHAMFIEGDTERICAIDAPDWRTNAAKERRASAIEAKRIPLLRHDAERAIAIVSEAQVALAMCDDLRGLGDVDAEETYVWEAEYGGRSVWLRCRPDWVTRDRRVILSYKTTGQIAEPDAYLRTLMNGGYHVQAAFELAGVEAVSGVRPDHYVWIVSETEPPYAVAFLGLSRTMRALGGAEMDRAVLTWAECMAAGPGPENWPSYTPRKIAYPEAPAWRLRELEALEA